MIRIRTAWIRLLAATLPTSGCNLFKKKPNVPAQTQAPSIEQSKPEEAQAEAPKPQTEKPAAEPVQEAAKPEAAASPATAKPKSRRTAKKPAPPPPAKPAAPAEAQQTASLSVPEKPGRVVISEGSAAASQPTLSTVVGHDEATHHRQTTEQLLEGTDSNLKGITRTLTADEQAMVRQIREYMEQSRTAASEQDLVRAHNLALKAHLLSDELVKR